jgi:hypothetical protein
MDLALKSDSYEKARREGIRILLEPKIAPGIHQIRAAVSQVGRRSGSVVYDIEVPDFEEEELVLSGVSLTSVETSAQRVSAGRNLLTGVLPGPLTATRQFSISDRIAVYAEVYDNSPPTDPVTVSAELRTLAGAAVRSATSEKSSNTLNQRRSGNAYLLEVPLEGVPPAAYVLRVQATASDVRIRSRDIPILVR